MVVGRIMRLYRETIWLAVVSSAGHAMLDQQQLADRLESRSCYRASLVSSDRLSHLELLAPQRARASLESQHDLLWVELKVIDVLQANS